MRRLALIVSLFAASACAGESLADALPGRYRTATPVGGTRAVEFRPDGSALWTESSPRGGVRQNVGRYTITNDTAYATFDASDDGQPFGMTAVVRGDSLSLVLAIFDVREPMTMLRER